LEAAEPVWTHPGFAQLGMNCSDAKNWAAALAIRSGLGARLWAT
jgi:hypothetical protein